MMTTANLLHDPVAGAEASRGLEVVIRRHTDIEVHPHDVFISTFECRLNDCHGFPDWLDVGCGWHFDWPWRAEREANLMSRANVVGIDADREALARHPHITKKAVGCLERLPFNSSSFDLLTANVVMEHVKYPALALSEVFRVLRPGGSFIFRTPSANNYFVKIARLIPQRPKVWLATLIERRKPEDVYPAYYRLNTAPAIAEICKMVGFTRVCITITKPRGVLRRAPLLAAIERAVTGSLGFDEGNLIVEIQK